MIIFLKYYRIGCYYSNRLFYFIILKKYVIRYLLKFCYLFNVIFRFCVIYCFLKDNFKYFVI